MAAAIALGDSTRARRELRAEQEQTARLIEQEHAYRAEQRVQAESVRMARDLHDVIGHSIAVISLHADVAREALGSDDEQVRQALAHIRAGAAGYLLKDLSPEELRRAIHVVAGGEALLAPSITRRVMQQLAARSGAANPQLLAELTEREREILRHIGLGESNDEIASSLVISPATARTYVSRLLAKLNARDRAHLVIIAYESGLITPGKT